VTTPRLVGLTGGIAAGKSTVAQLLTELGAVVIDADQLAREVTAVGSPALAEIRLQFGDAVFDASGELDRAKMAAIVFADPAWRVVLESITHPRIAQLSQQRIADAMASGVLLVVYAAPLLYERNLDQWLSEVIVVDIDIATQRQRLLARDGAAGLARVDSQLPLADKRRRATWIIDNSGTLEHTRAQVKTLWRELGS
jgi:dephospho-CoA kinase